MLRKNKEYPSPLLRARSKTSSLLKREWSNIQVTDVVVGRSHTREPLSEKTHILQFHTPSSGQGTQRSNIASAWGRGARCLVRQGLHVRWDRHQLPSGAGSPRESEARVAFWGWVSTWGRGVRCLLGWGLHVRERRALPGGRGLLRCQRWYTLLRPWTPESWRDPSQSVSSWL